MNVLAMVTRQRFLGVFTQRKILWAALTAVEGGRPADSLLIAAERGRIRDEGDHRYSPCTYTGLCKALRRSDTADLHDRITGEHRYRIFRTATNQARLGPGQGH